MDDYGDGEEDRPTASVGVWIGLTVLAAASFYAQALVTEERFVPSLNVIATHLNMSSDVAGATLMAAGASSPELFASVLSLFVTHSALGLGTIVGSEVFNQLVICAGSIQSARNNRLKLDKAILIREVSFYGLSLALLLVALSDRQPADDDELGYNHIYISFWDGLLLLGGYALYVVVCANFEPILRLFRRIRGSVDKKRDGSEYDAYKEGTARRTIKKQVSMSVPALPFLRQLSHEPRANFHSLLSQDDLLSLDDGAVVSDLHPSTHSAEQDTERQYDAEIRPASSDLSQNSTGCTSPRLWHAVLTQPAAPRPTQLHDLDEITKDESSSGGGVVVSCFLYQQSLFYNKARIDINAWHLRWFTFTQSFIESVPNRRDFNLHRIRYAGLSRRLEVDEDHLVLKFSCSAPERRDFVLMAPSRQVLEVAVEACERIIVSQEEPTTSALPAGISYDDSLSDIRTFASEAEEVTSLIEFPAGASVLSTAFHIILLPIKASVHYTVPDVRTLPPEKSWPQLRDAVIAICSCLVWIVAGSMAMCTSLEALGRLMGISDMLMGVTISAAGTSLPVLVASQAAAAQGLGNMAVSNAFGSNTFNIFIGLGLPWTLYCGLATRGEKYHGLRDDGITASTLILAAVLLAFVVLIFASNFVLYRWHAYIFIIMYTAYVVYAVVQDLTADH